MLNISLFRQPSYAATNPCKPDDDEDEKKEEEEEETNVSWMRKGNARETNVLLRGAGAERKEWE